MLLAHPAVLRDLVTRYETLRAGAGTGPPTAQLLRQLDDVAYTLCVTTGTRSVDQALAAARERMTAGPVGAEAPVG
ncbi:DUF5133 domain-containing protein [Streptomyces daliensis]|uniref:DUF5133 domain-containing protein n=1 Tax=Streptomyces daliensis TaxID=299421 RepID=A0A8T4IPY4_9ACTN|nr:DUF5133 domain-containing protein [Streptomyces daliensis]